MSNLRAGIVGYGLAGRVFHAAVLSAVPGLEFAAVVERNHSLAQQQYPSVTTYTSLQALLADRTIDLVVVATPTATHIEVVRQALHAGKHVVCDKPMGIVADDIAGLATLASSRGLILAPYHNRRFDNDFQTLQKLLHEGKLGKVVSFESTFDRWRPHPNPSAWREAPGDGSGILLDLGTHLVDQALFLFGLPIGVSAEVLIERPNAQAIDSFTIRLRYADKIATLAGNCLAAIPRPRYTVRGTLGNFVKYGLDPQEAALRLTDHPKIIEPWGRDPSSDWGTLATEHADDLVTQSVESIPGDYRLFYAAVRDAIRHSTAPPTTPQDAFYAARVLEHAQQSSREHREIPCNWA